MNDIDWLKILSKYPNVSPEEVSKAKESVNQLIVCQYGAVTPLEFAIRTNRIVTFKVIQWMVKVLGATPKYIHLILALDQHVGVAHFLHELGIRYVAFGGYCRHVYDAKKCLQLGEKELVEFVLCYPQYWYVPTQATPELKRLAKIAVHRQRAALRARIALVASLKRRIGKDMVREIVGYMKERSYVAKEEWGWSQ